MAIALNLATKAFENRNYIKAVELYEQCLRATTSEYVNLINLNVPVPTTETTTNFIDLLFGYGDSLAKSGRLKDSFKVYQTIYQQYRYGDDTDHRSVPLYKLKHLTLTLLDVVTKQIKYNSGQELFSINYGQIGVRESDPTSNQSIVQNLLSCPDCEKILTHPITSLCGHTYCRQCCIGTEFEQEKLCKVCGNRLQFNDDLKQDYLVSRLIEKWTTPVDRRDQKNGEWSIAGDECESLNDLAEKCLYRNHLDEALRACNECLQKSKSNIRGLLLRSEILFRLKHYRSSLSDADLVLSYQPRSSQGHLKKAQTLLALGFIDEALRSFGVSIYLNDRPSYEFKTFIRHEVAKILNRIFHTSCTPKYRQTQDIFNRRHKTNRSWKHIRHNFDQFVPTENRCILSDQLYSGDQDSLHDYPKRQRLDGNYVTIPIDYREKFPYQRQSCLKYQDILRDCRTIRTDRLDNLLDRLVMDVAFLKNSDSCNEICVRHPRVDLSDFECVLCCRTLWKPMVTICGHTYCLVCLERSLFYSPFCPLCKHRLIDDMSNQNLNRYSPSNFIETAMKHFIPTAYQHRQQQDHENDSYVPVFICTTAFPTVTCPLLVNEPRYRLMIRRAIESGQRQFGIVEPTIGQKRYSDVGTMLEIRDCVLLGDGRSILSTVGCRRFKVIRRDEKDGYDSAKVQFISDDPVKGDREIATLLELHEKVFRKALFWYDGLPKSIKDDILKSFGAMPVLEQQWLQLNDGPAWAWYITALLPFNQVFKGLILETTSLEKRLRVIDKTLDYLEAQNRKSVQVILCDGMDACQAADCCQRATSSQQIDEQSSDVEFLL